MGHAFVYIPSVIALAAVVAQIYRWARRSRSVEGDKSLASSLVQLAIPTGRANLRIVVIDDQVDKLFPTNDRRSLSSRGFSISYFSDITSLNDIAPYHIILCDVQGVGKSMSLPHGGLIVKELRAHRPMAYIIMYSGAANYDPEFNRYFALADSYANWSSLEGDKFDEILDHSIESLCSPAQQWKRFNKWVVNNTSIQPSGGKLEMLRKKFMRMSPLESATLENRIAGVKLNPKGNSRDSIVDMLLSASDAASGLTELKS